MGGGRMRGSGLGMRFHHPAVPIVLAILLVFFAHRLTKSKKFMPNGLMLILTLVTLALRHMHF